MRGSERKTTPAPLLSPAAQPGRVQLKERSGIWELRVDGIFRGDYHSKEHATAAAALARRDRDVYGGFGRR